MTDRTFATGNTGNAGRAAVLAAACSDCGRELDSERLAAGERHCAPCFDLFLRRADAEFLDEYARTGARSRIVVAEACLRALVLSDTPDRKLLAMSVYEQLVGAATDLLGLYYALLRRREAPITRGVLGFRLDVPHAIAFFEDLYSGGPQEFLDRLGLPHPEQVRWRAERLDKREQREVREALAEALGDLDRLTAFRDVGERALVSAASQLSRPVALASRTPWLERRVAPGQVAAMGLDAEVRRVEVNVLDTDEDTLGAVVDAIDTMTRLTRNLIFAFVSLHSPAQFEHGFLEG